MNDEVIDIRELRIGNILDYKGELVHVTWLSCDIDDEYEESIHFCSLGKTTDERGGWNRAICKDLNRVPLATEWLERMGFNLVDKEWTAWVGIRKPVELYRHVKQYDFEVVRDKETGVIHRLVTANGDEYGNRDGMELKYVHQLQNLYFALTGEELTINFKS